jgi:glycosyltransferase involved in cell wall biosynthesis
MHTPTPPAREHSDPRVGVIIPCFNQGRYASECVASLWAQTHTNWRAVLVDDASTDGISAKLCGELESPKVTVVRLARNAGRSLVRNVGAGQLRDVDYILSLDCDDVLTPEYMAFLVQCLQQDERVGVAYGALEYFGTGYGNDTFKRSWPTKPWQRSTMYLENNIPGPGAMFRKRALDQTAGWRAEFTSCSGEDYDIWLQVVEAGWLPAWEPNAIYRYRQHAASFLALSTQRTHLAHDLAILSMHSRQIRHAGVTMDYLRTKIGPAFFSAIQARELASAWSIVSVCALRAPFPFASLVLTHYCHRLLARLKWHRS